MWVSRSEMEYQESLELNKKMQNLSIEESNQLNANEESTRFLSQANTAREINNKTNLLSNDNLESNKSSTVNLLLIQLGRLCL